MPQRLSGVCRGVLEASVEHCRLPRVSPSQAAGGRSEMHRTCLPACFVRLCIEARGQQGAEVDLPCRWAASLQRCALDRCI